MRFSTSIFVYFIILQLFSGIAFSQDSSYIKTNDLIDDLLEEPDEESDNSELYDELESLAQNPIDLNSAGIDELQKIPYIDLLTAKLIILQREKFGKFFSADELYSIRKIPKETIVKIIPFVTAKIKKHAQKEESNSQEEAVFYQELLNDSRISIRSRMTEKIQNDRGFVENKYLGSKYKIYNKLLVRYSDKIEMGLLTDKDPGENQFNDFSSFHLAVNNFGILKSAVAGDYLIQFGQGLALSSPFGFSKGADAVYPIKKRGKSIKPYSSALENNFRRGLAASIEFKSFTLTSFISKNKFDANIDSISGIIISSPVDGYHRTATEISKRKTASETLIGSSLIFNINKSIELGALYYHSKMSNPFFPSIPYGLSGTDFNYESIYYNIYWLNFNIAGESAYDGTSVASFISLEFSISRNFSFITSVRNYPHNYKNLHGFGFGEKNGTEQNEVGFYNGFKWNLPFGILNFYFDQFKFPYASYFIPLPVQGNEYLINFLTKPIKNLELKFRYKNENKEQLAGTPESARDFITKRLRENYRLEVVYSLSKSIKLKERFEYCRYNINYISAKEEGYLVFQDIRFQPLRELTFYGRIAFFITDSFNSAVYTYENDLNGILSSTSLYGQGIRWYLVAKYKFLNSIVVSAKYSEIYKPDVKTMGTGYSEINSNIENRFGLQIDVGI